MILHRGFAIAVAAYALLVPVRVASAGFTINPDYADGTTDAEKALFQMAINAWLKLLDAPPNTNIQLTIHVKFDDIGTTIGGGTGHFITGSGGFPSSATMIINTNPAMDYDPTQPVDPNKYDALTAMEHELGHALGFAFGGGTTGYAHWNNQFGGGTNIFDPSGLHIIMSGTDAQGRSHVDQDTYPNDLMDPNLFVGVRKSPSALDVLMLEKAFGYVPEPTTFLLVAIGAVALFGCHSRKRIQAAANGRAGGKFEQGGGRGALGPERTAAG
jgi:hypothetical protein